MAQASTDGRATIPRDRDNEYAREAADQRRAFVEEHTDAKLEHVSSYSFDPEVTSGNIENFVGVAQVPLGVAGPLVVHGEHAQGNFYVPWPQPRARFWPPKTAA
jgi:hydroxymethylglutaryl-CoA reductase (NADPH)